MTVIRGFSPGGTLTVDPTAALAVTPRPTARVAATAPDFARANPGPANAAIDLGRAAEAIGAVRGNIIEVRSAIGDASDDLADLGGAQVNAYYDPRSGTMSFPGLSPSDKHLTARERIFKKIETDVGPLVDSAAAPRLAETLLAIFDRLAAAQDERAEGHDTLSVNELFFADTPVENAFVVPQAERGVRLVHSLSFVSSGIMRSALGIDSGDLHSDDPVIQARGLARFNDGMSAIAGLCAHELAHPLDDIESKGFARTSNKESARHAIELKADIQGVLLLRDAGFPVDGLRRALSLFLGRDTARIGVSAVSTHPPTDLRIITLELAETLARYEHGPAEVSHPFTIDLETARAMSDELRGLEAYRKRWEFVRPESYEATLARLAGLGAAASAADRSADWPVVEQNRLLVCLGEQLAAREAAGKPPRGVELETLFAVLTRLGEPIADTQGLRTLMTSVHVSEQFAKAPSFRARAEKSRLLRGPEARAVLEKLRPVHAAKALEAAHDPLTAVRAGMGWADKVWRTNLELVHRFSRLLPAELAANFMEGQLSEMFSDVLSGVSGKIAMGPTPEALLGNLPHPVRMTLAARYIQRHLADDPVALAALGASGTLGTSGLLPLESSKQQPRATRLRATMRSPSQSSVAAEYSTAMRKIWERRGAIAFGNALSSERIDWQLIAELAGVSSRDVDADVRAAVQEHFSVGNLPIATPAQGAGSPPAWLDDRTARRYLAMLTPACLEPGRQPTTTRDILLNLPLTGTASLNMHADGLLRRLRCDFDTTGKHNAYVGVALEVMRASFARGDDAWIGELLGEEVRDIVDGVGSIPATPRFLELVLDTLETIASPAQRLALLPKLFVGKVPMLVARSPRLARLMLAFRERAGGPGSATDFVLDFKASFQPSTMPVLMGSCAEQLSAELAASHAAAARKRTLLALAKQLDSSDKVDAVTAERLHPLKEALVALARTLPDLDATNLHGSLARTGATRATDAYCVDMVLPTADQDAIEKLLRSGLLYSDQLRLDLAVSALESRWPAVDAMRSQRNLAITQNLERFNDYAPEASRQRDDFLEQLGWRFGLRNRELNAFVEDQKSANWRRADPVLARLGSAAATAIAGLDRHSRQVFINSLIHRKRGEPFTVPAEVRRALVQGTAHFSRDVAASTSEDAAMLRSAPTIIAVLERHISDASPIELIPLIAMTMRSGVNALTNESNFPLNVMHHLGCEPGDQRSVTLESFLETLPPHEWPITLAYFMSQEGDARDYVSGFEVFDAPGIMVGQLAHTFGLVEGVEALKHDAKRLTKATIHAELADLPRSARDLLDERITDFVQIVGSAKLKTVVEVKLDDGRRAALMVRRPNVTAKVEANFEQGRRFVAALQRRGVKLPLKLVGALIDAAETQMHRELDFREEASRLAGMRTTLDELNHDKDLAPLLDGWRFAVPQLIEGVPAQETMLLTEFAEGVAFSGPKGEPQLDAATRAALGPALVKASLMLLFRHGTFEADRHLGNWRFDPITKTINFIDIGQLTDLSRTNAWKSDDRLVLARFMAAWSKRDASGLTDAFVAMSTNGSAVDRTNVQRAIEQVLADPSLETSGQLARLAEAALEEGIELEHRFLFGGVKGLMVLASEGYVDSTTFAEILADEVKGLIKKKMPAMAGNTLKSLLAGKGLRVG